MYYHSNQQEKELITFWSSGTNINKKQFYVSTVHKKSSQQSTKHLKFGTISLRYSDLPLLEDILERIRRLVV